MTLSRKDLSEPGESREDAAAAWFALQRADEMSAADAAAFDAWRADPANAEAFAACERMWGGVEAMRAHPRMLALREKALGAATGSRTLMLRAAAIGTIALGAAGAWGMQTGALPDFFVRPIEQEFRTSVGQRTTVRLPDGSVVTLDTDTVLKSKETSRRRLIALERGRAYFEVAKDASRPFIVSAGGRTVRATGTAFDVRVEPERFEVILVEGRVRVEAPVSQESGGAGVQVAELAPGTRLVAAGDENWRLSRVNVGRETSWLNGQLVYEGAPLGEVARELNRYSRRKIVIDDPMLAAAPIAGTFPAGDAEGFVRAVGVARVARIAKETDEAIMLAPR